MHEIQRPSIGVIGYGFIGRYLVEQVSAPGSGMELAWVHNRTSSALSEIDGALVLDDLGRSEDRPPTLVVEAAHPRITVDHGARLLERSDYLPLSTTALADRDVWGRCVESAMRHGSRLLLASGALIGGDALTIGRERWERVRVTFRKHPRNIDASEAAGLGIDAGTITAPTRLFEGSAREIARHFPRNVNTMVTAGLLSVGLDRCECVLVADPALDVAVAEVEAWGDDGSYISSVKRQPAIGVSGTEMAASVWLSVRRAVAAGEGTVVHV